MVKQLLTFLNDNEFEFLRNLKRENKTTWRRLILDKFEVPYSDKEVKKEVKVNGQG